MGTDTQALPQHRQRIDRSARTVTPKKGAAMGAWWQKEAPDATTKKAVAYYRHSAQDRQENSVPLQREQVREFADEHGIKIIKEFADHGKSGLSTVGRDAFNEMIRDYVEGNKEDFDYVLVLDISRWGRFQDIDESAYYTSLCHRNKKQVIYTSIGFPKEDDLIHYLHVNIERYRAASYSRELSGKVFKGCAKIAQQGFRAGGPAPYALQRLLLDEQRNPVQFLSVGQRKSIQNQRVTLAAGDTKRIKIVQRIFTEFVDQDRTPSEIAEGLNSDGIPSPGGKTWSSSAVRTVLSNELYVGTMVYNKTQQRLQSPTRHNPRDEWIRTENAFDGVVDQQVFSRAQEKAAARKAELERLYSPEDMLEKLDRLFKRYGKIGPRQIASEKEMASASTYAKRFSSLDMAYQNLFRDVLQQVRRDVTDRVRQHASAVQEIDDFLVVDETFSLLIQPSVPIPNGFDAYWPFRPDPRSEVDITLGVPLSDGEQSGILGFLLLPRLMVDCRGIRLTASSNGRLELHGYHDLEVVEALLE